jgi:hypothetical protein
MDKNEVWKNVPNYSGYQVSSRGRVKSLQRVEVGKDGKKRTIKYKMLSMEVTENGYHRVGLTSNGVLKRIKVHQLVAMAFLGHVRCGNDLVVNHKNFVRSDNRVENLEIVTSRENSSKNYLKSASKHIGVTHQKPNNKWVARIRANGKRVRLGVFETEDEAGLYYDAALAAIKNGTEIMVKKYVKKADR